MDDVVLPAVAIAGAAIMKLAFVEPDKDFISLIRRSPLSVFAIIT